MIKELCSKFISTIFSRAKQLGNTNGEYNANSISVLSKEAIICLAKNPDTWFVDVSS